MKPAIALSIGLFAATPAWAGESACIYENGVIVAPASVMGVAGDYVFDTGSPHTQLADTQAQTAGFAGTALRGEVRVAGVVLNDQPVAVAALDLRTGALPTPVAGVIGADVLRGYVVDVSFAPCRLALRRPGQAPPFGRAVRLAMVWVGGTPAVRAGVSDGPHAYAATFSAATGSDTAVRLADDAAHVRPAAAKPRELYPYGVLRPRLRALSFAGDLSENLPAGLIAAAGDAPVGEIGAPVLAHYRLRFDFPGGRMLLAPARP